MTFGQAGIQGVAHDFLRSYLSNRMQYTDCNVVTSELTGVKVGVNQGGVLSPLLFIIFNNDFFSLPIEPSPFSSSDDFNMFKSSAIIADSVTNLETVPEYFRLNKLTLNFSETKSVHFRKPRVKIDGLPAPVLNGVMIETCSSVSVCWLGRALCEDQQHHLSWRRCYQ